MKIEGNFNVGGEIVKQDERYVVQDNRLLKNLILSSTRLNAWQRDHRTSTRGTGRSVYVHGRHGRDAVGRKTLRSQAG
jgi:hypothetical protein